MKNISNFNAKICKEKKSWTDKIVPVLYKVSPIIQNIICWIVNDKSIIKQGCALHASYRFVILAKMDCKLVKQCGLLVAQDLPDFLSYTINILPFSLVRVFVNLMSREFHKVSFLSTMSVSIDYSSTSQCSD